MYTHIHTHIHTSMYTHPLTCSYTELCFLSALPPPPFPHNPAALATKAEDGGWGAGGLTSGSEWHSFVNGRRIPRGSVVSSGWLGSTLPDANRACGALPGTLLKSPATIMGMSALAAIFSRPLSSVCTCHSFTSFSSGFAWMCVLATHNSWRLLLPFRSGLSGASRASSTTMSATLSWGGEGMGWGWGWGWGWEGVGIRRGWG